MSDINGTVAGIQGRDVDSAAPNDGDVYRWDAANSKWVPVAPPQPLEPWVGTPNTQQQVIQRIPWVCTTTSTAVVSTGVSVNVPTDKALLLYAVGAARLDSSPVGCVTRVVTLVVMNNGGTLTAPASNDVPTFTGSLANMGTILLEIGVSGTVATLQVHTPSSTGAPIDCQGYVDLMLL